MSERNEEYTCSLAARLSRGELGEAAASVIATAEDSPSTTVRPRLEAVQANLDVVHFITIQSDDGLEDGIAIPDDLDSVAAAMQALDARLLVIDPLVAHLPSEIDSHKDQSVRRALAPLYRLAQELDCAIVVLIHLNKAQGMQPLQRLSGRAPSATPRGACCSSTAIRTTPMARKATGGCSRTSRATTAP